MALDKIKFANKKQKHEHRRAIIRSKIMGCKQHAKVRRKRVREMFIQGRREYIAKRAADKSYIAQLESEIENDSDISSNR